MAKLRFNTEYLNDYLELVEDTESPRLFHLWCALFNISAALGRRCYLPFGPMVIYPNHYVLLVGTPGTRKSTAASMAKRVLKQSTGVRFAPADTAGQRQGLVLAMHGNPQEQSKEFLHGAEIGAQDRTLMSLADIKEVTNDPVEEELQYIATADKHHMAVVSSEFSRFIGQNNLQMLDFLTTMWDGDDYEYRTKTADTVLKNPLLNIIGCTTPTQISNSLPPAAGGQGFLSRMILVYGARKYKPVPRPVEPNPEILSRVKEALRTVYYDCNGTFDETPEAREYSESLYEWPLEITDSRFGYYNERRYTHLIKLAMCLAAASARMTITKSDYEEAHRILRATERGMPDALGEFGMNPLAALKQEILEQLRALQGPVRLDQVQAMFHRDARPKEIMEVLQDLQAMKSISIVQPKSSGELYVTAVVKQKSTEDDIMNLLAER